MDELPSEAKSVLELAKGAQPGAEDGTRERVRGRVEAAIAAVAMSHGELPSPSLDKFAGAKSWLTSSKIMLASAILLVGGGGALWAVRGPGTSRDSVAAPVAASGALPAAEQPGGAGGHVAAAAPTPPEQRSSTPVERASPARTATGASAENHHALAAEMLLLAQAADALASQDVSKARSALSEHRKRFQRPQLREERDGLSVLARCIENPDGALSEALAFVRRSPSSMLATRIKRACGLSDGT